MPILSADPDKACCPVDGVRLAGAIEASPNVIFVVAICAAIATKRSLIYCASELMLEAVIYVG